MSGTKVAVIVLVLLALVFASTFVGHSKETPQRRASDSASYSEHPPSLAKAFGRLTPNHSTLGVERVHGACVVGDTIRLAAMLPCVLAVDSLARPGYQFLILQVLDGLGASVLDQAMGVDASQSKTIATGEVLKLPVSTRGGRITISCLPGPPCRLQRL